VPLYNRLVTARTVSNRNSTTASATSGMSPSQHGAAVGRKYTTALRHDVMVHVDAVRLCGRGGILPAGVGFPSWRLLRRRHPRRREGERTTGLAATRTRSEAVAEAGDRAGRAFAHANLHRHRVP